MTYDERELKQLYQAMREEDARRAPGFAQSFRALPRHARLGYLRAVAITAVLAVFGLAIAVNALRRRDVQPVVSVPPAITTHEPAPAPATAAAELTPPKKSVGPRRKPTVPPISDWTSPTASLLDLSNDDLLTTSPSLEYKSAHLSD